MPRPLSKYFRIPPAPTATAPVPFQSFYSQGMRQLAYQVNPGPITAGVQEQVEVFVPANTFADGKHLLLECAIMYTGVFPGVAHGLTIMDTWFFDHVNVANATPANPSSFPIGVGFSRGAILRWDLFLQGTHLYGVFMNSNYFINNSSASIGPTASLQLLDPGGPPNDWTIDHILSIGITTNIASPDVSYDWKNVRALIESPVNIGRN